LVTRGDRKVRSAAISSRSTAGSPSPSIGPCR
jgi:hypothetical protein